MEQIIAILMYLQIIICDVPYSNTEIEHLKETHIDQVEAVLQNPTLLQTIEKDFQIEYEIDTSTGNNIISKSKELDPIPS